MTICIQILFFVLFSPFVSSAHEGHHPGRERKGQSPIAIKDQKEILERIGIDYKARIEPIFSKKCMNCHSSRNLFPWYSKIPGIKQLIENDVSEAKHHMDMSLGYPFISHASPLEDLEAIEESVLQKTDMPPFRYWIMHPTSRLTQEEKIILKSWIDQSKKHFN